jgi:short-subunit dehydrogenase
MRLIDGATAVVTGSSGRIGRAVCDRLAAGGARLVLTDLPSPALGSQRAALEARGVPCVAVEADLSRSNDRARLIEQAGQAFGPVDILVNNAGLGHWAAVQDQSLGEIAYVIEVNLVAALDLARLVLPGMIDRGRGQLVMVSSMVGKRGIPYEAVYSASKAGMIQWSHATRLEIAASGVGVSVICPGYVSRAGMFARWRHPAPGGAGSVTPERVAKAIVDAILRDQQEVLVWPVPPRPLLVLDAISPSIGNWLIRRMGIEGLNRRLAELDDTARKAAGRAPDPPSPPDA